MFPLGFYINGQKVHEKMLSTSALLIIREMQVDHNEISPHTTEIASMEKKNTVGEDVEKLEPFALLVRL